MRRTAIILLLCVAAVGCGKKQVQVARSLPPAPGPASSPGTPRHPTSPHPTSPAEAEALNVQISDLYGLASWYGHPYHGRKTASGEVYDMYQLTAAHKTLPIGTRVEVTNQTNGKQVEVRINDRGPFIEGRVIDLSYAAAKEIEMIGPGMATVNLRPLDVASTRFGVQVGTFRERENALRLHERLSRRHPPVSIAESGELYRVLVGCEPTELGAQAIASLLRRENIYGKVVMLP